MFQVVFPYNGTSGGKKLINYVLTIYLLICKTAQLKC